MNEEQTRIPQGVISQFGIVRQTGRCNMLDKVCVQFVANDLGLSDLVCWIEEGMQRYSTLLTTYAEQQQEKETTYE